MLGKTEILDTNLTGQRCSCTHHPAFSPRISWPKRVQGSVAPGVITALPQLWIDPSSLIGPVSALRYYLDRTSGRIRRWVFFVSFKKGFRKDILPATISSWIKQTVILCYELSDQEAHTLHQVKPHDVRAFDASRVFQSGVFLRYSLVSLPLKSHNTFTQFYQFAVKYTIF